VDKKENIEQHQLRDVFRRGENFVFSLFIGNIRGGTLDESEQFSGYRNQSVLINIEFFGQKLIIKPERVNKDS